MSIPILAGRGFAASDTQTSPKVAVINQELARKYFPDTNPIGKTFRGYQSVGSAPFEIVGVCGDIRYDSLRKPPPATYYLLYSQLQSTGGSITYEVRTRVAPYSVVPLIRRTIQSVDKNAPAISMRTQTDQIDDTIRPERLFTGLTVSLGILGLMLACIGIYGVMMYTVARRTNEIGIRLALGAQKRTIIRMILREAFWVTLVGVVAGLGSGFVLTRYLRTMLFELTPDDPITMTGAALLLTVVSLSAAFIPALRASRLEPSEALRCE